MAAMPVRGFRGAFLPGLLLVAFLLQGFALPLSDIDGRLSRSSLSQLAEAPDAPLAGVESGRETASPAGLWAVLSGWDKDRRLGPGSAPLRISGSPVRPPGWGHHTPPALPRPPPAV